MQAHEQLFSTNFNKSKNAWDFFSALKLRPKKGQAYGWLTKYYFFILSLFNFIIFIMINYSIVMRSVNANLFEINQAKSRIKAAKANNQTPAQADLDLVKTEVQNAYAIAQYADVMTIEKFAKHIATHGCVYSRADIAAILYLAVDCMRELLLEGKKIRLGDLGDFSVSLTSKGAKDAKTFSAQNITGVNVVWDCGQDFKNLLADAEFNLVASRSAQAAVVSAIKAGKTLVDLNDPKNSEGGTTTPPTGGTTTPPTGNGGNGTTTNPPTGGSDDEDEFVTPLG